MNNMKYLDELKIARKSLKTNKIRTILSIFSIIIGIAVVTIVISAGESLEKLIYSQMESFGSNIIQTEIKVPGTQHASSDNASGLARGITITTLKDGDRKAIIKLKNIKRAYSMLMGQELLSWQGNINRTNVFAVTSDFIKIDSAKLYVGRFFSEEEDNSLDRLIILGSKVKEDLFGNSDALGENVKIKKMNFKVIGVMEERGSTFGFDMDNFIYLPLQTTQKLIMGIDYVTAITSEMIDSLKEKETVESVVSLMRRRHNISNPNRDDFGVMAMTDAKEIMSNVVGGVKLLLLALAIISLVVGGVGIMNIMYVSVAERKFEIGLRKAVGSSKKQIMNQFIIEAIFVTFLGGLGGIILGFFITYLIYFIANYINFDWPFSFSLFGMILSLIFSISIGFIFGLRPAKKASELNPVEALRND